MLSTAVCLCARISKPTVKDINQCPLVAYVSNQPPPLLNFKVRRIEWALSERAFKRTNKITNVYWYREPFPFAFEQAEKEICIVQKRKKIEVIEFRVLHYYLQKCVYMRERWQVDLIISVSLSNHICVKTQEQQSSQKDHSQGSNTEVIMTTPLCIPHSLIKGHSVCYKIACHIQELGILNHAVCSQSWAYECL